LSGDNEHHLTVDLDLPECDHGGSVRYLEGDRGIVHDRNRLDGQRFRAATAIERVGTRVRLDSGGSANAGTVPRSVTATTAEEIAIRTSFIDAPNLSCLIKLVAPSI
jgi:hypothetical protein